MRKSAHEAPQHKHNLSNFICVVVVGNKYRRSKMGKVKNVKGQAWYLSKYLSGEDFERYYFSKGWVFPGWIGFSQWFKKEFSIYPPREMLIELRKMSKVEREGHSWFGVYLWEKERNKYKNWLRWSAIKHKFANSIK